MPIAAAAIELARQVGVSVIAPKTEETISADLIDVDAETAFRQLAKAAGQGVSLQDGIIVFGSAEEGQETFAIIDPGFIAPADATAVVEAVLGNDGQVRQVGERIAYGGSVEGLRRVQTIADGFRYGPDGWMLRVLVFEVSDAVERQIGIGTSFAADADAVIGVDTGSAFPPAMSGARASAAVSLLARYAEDGREARVRTMGTLFLLEGDEAYLQRGDSVPIPQRTTTPEGTVVTEGFQYVDAGFQLTARGRRVPGGLRLEVEPRISSIASFVEDAPVFTQQSVTGSMIVRSGEWAILSGLSRVSDSKSSTGLPGGWGGSNTRDSLEDTSLLICVNARRVTRGVDEVTTNEDNS